MADASSESGTGQASSGAGIAGDPTVGGGGYAGPSGFGENESGVAPVPGSPAAGDATAIVRVWEQMVDGRG